MAMTHTDLLIQLSRMVRERKEYYLNEVYKCEEHKQTLAAERCLAQSLAYENVGDMIDAVLALNKELLDQFDYFGN